MDNSDEKFFEQLAGASKPDADDKNEKYEVELAKASTAPSRVRATRAKVVKDEDDIVEEEVAMEVSTESNDEDSSPAGSLIVDVYQTADDFVVQSAIAGVKADDIDITATPDKLVIRGAREHEQEVGGEDYLCQECYWGRFAREIIFPQEVDPEGANVTFKNGILTVRLPKTSKKKTKKLRVSE